MDKCAKHDEVMDRTFTEVNAIKVKMESIDTKMDTMIEFKDMVHKVIFGNGTPGLKGKVETIVGAVNKQWFLMGIILTAILTAVAMHFWKT